jgi:hypothetical protein
MHITTRKFKVDRRRMCTVPQHRNIRLLRDGNMYRRTSFFLRHAVRCRIARVAGRRHTAQAASLRTLPSRVMSPISATMTSVVNSPTPGTVP